MPVAESVVLPAAPALAPYVAGYHAYRYEGFPPGLHLGLPSRHLTLVLSLDRPTELASCPLPEQGPVALVAMASGLATRPAVIAHDGAQYGLQLPLTPAGSRALLGLPAGELGAWVVDLREVLGPVTGELVERLRAAPTWPERGRVLDAVLVARLARSSDAQVPGAELRRAWARLVGGGGTARVADVAREVGWSRRHLGERFRAEYGLTPKEAARVARFECSHRALRRDPARSLADVAAACGYYDQAHLARDWRDLAGCPPSRWLADEELPSVQAGSRRPGASSGA